MTPPDSSSVASYWISICWATYPPREHRCRPWPPPRARGRRGPAGASPGCREGTDGIGPSPVRLEGDVNLVGVERLVGGVDEREPLRLGTHANVGRGGHADVADFVGEV